MGSLWLKCKIHQRKIKKTAKSIDLNTFIFYSWEDKITFIAF